MPSLDEIRQMIIDSGPEHWHKPQPGPYFTDGYDVDENAFRSHDELYVFKPDVDLTIQEGLEWGHNSREITKSTQVWDCVEFPDETVRVRFADIFWRGVLVDRVQVVSVDGARAVLPFGSRTLKNGPMPMGSAARGFTPEWDNTATAFETAVARIVDGDREFEEYFRQSGMRISG